MRLFAGVLFLAMTTGLFAQTPQRTDIIIADFEGETYGDWKVQGTAFGASPAREALPRPDDCGGIHRKRFRNLIPWRRRRDRNANLT